MAVGTGILSYIMLACTMKKMSVVAIILGVVVYFHFNGEIKDKLKEWGLTLGMTDISVLKNSIKVPENKEVEENEA